MNYKFKPNDKVRIIASPYTTFEVGKEYTVSYFDDRPYGIFVTGPRFEGSNEDDVAQWPFHRDEVELAQ